MIDDVFKDVRPKDIEVAARVMWSEVHNHPAGASCFCPAVEVLCNLYEQGYRMVRD